MKRTLFLLLLAVVAACRARERPAAQAAAATGPTVSPTAAPQPVLGYIDESGKGKPIDRGVLRRRLPGEPGTLNAVTQSTGYEQQVLAYLSRNLLDFDARMRVVPGLAERYEILADGRTFRFTLHREAVWEDGTPVTAADAVYTIQRIRDPKISSPVFKPVFEGLESVEAADDRTFTVKFQEAYVYRPMAFVLPLLPANRYAGKNFARVRENRAPLSNGPYRLVSWRPQESIELERNPRYWGDRGHFEKVIFRILPENAVALSSAERGDLDETQLDTSGKERALADPAARSCCRMVEYYDLNYNYIALNDKSPFFSDARVRRALTMLLDRGKIVRTLFKGSARVISGPWAPDSPAYDPGVAPLPFDPAGAAALLDAAGWRDTNGDGTRDRDGKEMRFELLAPAGSTISQEIDETLAAELARVGVRAAVRPLEWAAFAERIDAGDFEAASLAWSASDPNPDPFPYWHSSQWPPNGLNSGFYKNAEADRLMEEARRESDDRKRLDLYHRLHVLFRDDAPAIFITNASQKYLFARRVHGLVTSPLGLYGIWPGPLAWWREDQAAP
ncbi:MAG TPA: ABC transporter substrate-binding protein [Thermoanaerobaculia bacterium]|nr:ABC transporter substrate-binding protein [Thermoanaerobaculia bacterium]